MRLTLVRRNLYHDSVALLGLARELRACPGVLDAAALMATPANRELLAQAGLLTVEGEAAGPADLVVAVEAATEEALDRCRALAEDFLAAARRPAGRQSIHRPRTLGSARRRAPAASVALISVPGAHAPAEARRALALGLHVLLFSDNVPLRREVDLKRDALSRGLLLMGPDCGTAYLGGVPLGFANEVPRGRIGIVSASGTGLQQVVVLLAAQGLGPSQAIGVGGRDMSAEVGGLMTLFAIDALARDPGTDLLVVIGKPPALAVRARIEAAVRAHGKPAVLAILGPDVTPGRDGQVVTVATLEDAALAARALGTGEAWAPAPFGAGRPEVAERVRAARARRGPGQRAVRGLYAGGTLAHEAALILASLLGPIGGNLGADRGGPHRVWDLGADEFTRARAHPMLDPTARIQAIGEAARDPATAVLLLDVVLGHGAAPDPAGDLAPAIEAARTLAERAGRALAVVAAIVGTEADPQGLGAQRATLESAGAWVLPSNAQAARAAACIAGDDAVRARLLGESGGAGGAPRAPSGAGTPADAAPEGAPAAARPVHAPPGPAGASPPEAGGAEAQPPAPLGALLAREPCVINVGLASFARDLEARGVDVVHVEWAPPAGGDERLGEMLARLGDGGAIAPEVPPGAPRPAGAIAIGDANRLALERLVAAEPVLVDCAPARLAMGLDGRVVLHAGPPLTWARACATMQAAICCAIRYEGWAPDDASARRLVERGEVSIMPCHHARAVGPMTGMITPSMPVLVVTDRAHGTVAHVAINEGVGRVLRFGANDGSVVERLVWLAREAGPLLGRALRRAGGIELGPLMAQALRMGDEMHQRNVAASSLLLRRLAPHLAREAPDAEAAARVLEFIAANDQFFLNLAMAAGKVSAEAALAGPGSTMVTTMARNGTDFGIRVAGLGDRWFVAPVEMPEGLYFPGFGPEDANPDMGDSAIVETIGLGAFAMAASPAVAGFVGAGGLADAMRITEEMAEICLGEHPRFRMPTLDDRGTPVGIDVRRVVETGIAPLINTGIAGVRPGTGQIGAGMARAPLACFAQALAALAEGADR